MKNLVRPLLLVALLLVLVLALAACEKDRPAPAGTATRGAAGTPGAGTRVGTQVAPAAGTAGAKPAGQGTPLPAGAATPVPPTPQPLLPPPTASAPGTPGTTDSATYFMYTLAQGDTLGLLAKRFNTTVDSILALNQMTNPDVVSVGQQLKIPGEKPPELGGYARYTVQAGDTLSSIARTYNISLAELQNINGITNPDVVTPGQVLKVPGAGAASAGTAGTTAGTTSGTTAGAATSVPVPTAPPAGAMTTYTVQPGDTLGRIAQRYGTTTAQLMALNNIANANRIYPYQVLKVPVKPGASAAPSGSASGRTHVVAKGETLYTIATKYGVTAAAIQAANNLSNPNQIIVGQVLQIP
jgi:LysM repeat protein